MLNIHHLELFYFVARHGGIAQAVRNMPYGIQQPAISAQILALEDHLGVTLFRRRPFELTDPGRQLYGFIEPFFGGLDGWEARLRGGATERLRVGASQTVLRDHLPGILRDLRRLQPPIKLVLRSGYQQELEQFVQQGELDLAVTVIDRDVGAGLKSEILIEVPLALLVPKSMKVKSAEEILGQDRIGEPLISMQGDEAVPRLFQNELARRGASWPVAIEVGTLELIPTYVSEGFGVGLSVAVPGAPVPRGLRWLPLPDFPKVAMGILWMGRLGPASQRLVERLRDAARVLTAAAAGISAEE